MTTALTKYQEYGRVAVGEDANLVSAVWLLAMSRNELARRCAVRTLNEVSAEIRQNGHAEGLNAADRRQLGGLQ